MIARLVLLLALAAAFAGCTAAPEYPLLSPLAATGQFGYAETARGDDRFSVVYVTPVRYADGAGAADPRDAEAARQLGYDMALWRAAQLASARGLAGFRVSDRQADVTVYPDPLDLEPVPPPFWGPLSWRYRDPFWRVAGPWFPPRLLVTARVTLEVELLRQPGPGDYDAAREIARLDHAYPGAATAPVQ